MKIEPPSKEKWEKLDKLVDGRSRNQRSSVRLYAILADHKNKIDQTRRFRAFYNTLLGANFSLWRAVFLTDLVREEGSMIKHAGGFITELIENNAINYGHEAHSPGQASQLAIHRVLCLSKT